LVPLFIKILLDLQFDACTSTSNKCIRFRDTHLPTARADRPTALAMSVAVNVRPGSSVEMYSFISLVKASRSSSILRLYGFFNFGSKTGTLLHVKAPGHSNRTRALDNDALRIIFPKSTSSMLSNVI